MIITNQIIQLKLEFSIIQMVQMNMIMLLFILVRMKLTLIRYLCKISYN